MSEKRFFTKVNKNGRNVIIDKECHIEIIDLTLACEVLNRLDLKLKHYNEVNGEQQATITALKEENEQLLRCKYFVKAVEVFTDCPISETIADYSDGELFDEEEQLEFGKKMLEQEKELVEDE